MNKYCKYCGKPVDGQNFCLNCGKAVEGFHLPGTHNVNNKTSPSNNPQAIHKQKREKKKDTPVRKAFKAGLIALALLLLGTGVWAAGDLGGVWDKMSLDKASQAWKKQSDYKDEQKAVLECLNSLADTLERGDIDGSLEYIDSDKADYFKALFEDNQSSLPNLIYALRKSELSYLSDQDASYDALRTATVSSELNDNSSASTKQYMIIRLLKLDDGWVVTSL